MQLVGALLFAVAACTARGVKNSSPDMIFFYFAGDDEEEVSVIDSSEPIDKAFVRNYTADPDNNGFWLFTRSNPVTPQLLRYKDVDSIKHSHFHKEKTTAILAHGWRGSCNSKVNTILTEAFLQEQDVNVIVFDWSALAGHNYLTAKYGVPGVGQGLGQFINWLVTLGASYERMHLVGHSLGGHLMGNAGRETDGKVKRVTALDPAGPLWYTDSLRLNSTDGQYVEVIHTTSLLGYLPPIGNADFYPNGGAIQPGCGSTTCSHSRAYEYMAASIKFDHFAAKKCKNLMQMEFNKCNGDIEFMGNSKLSAKSDFSKTRTVLRAVNSSRLNSLFAAPEYIDWIQKKIIHIKYPLLNFGFKNEKILDRER